MDGWWTKAWPDKPGFYWTLVPGGTVPTLLEITRDTWIHLQRDWDLQGYDWDADTPSLFWSEPLVAPAEPNGFRLRPAGDATWTLIWPEVEGIYWLSHTARAVALAK